MATFVVKICFVAIIFDTLLLDRSDGGILKQKVLVVSFDGFALHYIKDGNINLPAFRRLRRESTFTESMRSVFPSETFPNHFSMATGLYPESHGMVSNIFYDPEFKFLYNAMGYGSDSRPDLDQQTWWAAEPMWITARRQGLKTGTSCWPGDRVKYNVDEMQADYHREDFTITVPFEKRIDEAIDWFTRYDVDLVYLYSFQPDATGHRFGVNCPEMETTLQQVDRELAYLLLALERANFTASNFNLIVASDHGMWNLEREIVFADYVNTTELFERTTRFGANVPIWPVEGRNQEIVDALTKVAEQNDNLFRVYHKHEMPPQFHYTLSPRIPPVIAVGKVGVYLTETQKFSKNRLRLKGGHGYDPSDYRMQPMFFARGPPFRRNFNATDLTANMTTKDIYAVVAELIGMKYPPPVNASYEIVEGLFRTDYTFLTVRDLRLHSQPSPNSNRSPASIYLTTNYYYYVIITLFALIYCYFLKSN